LKAAECRSSISAEFLSQIYEPVLEKLPKGITVYLDQETLGQVVKAARNKPEQYKHVSEQPGGLHVLFAAELGLFKVHGSFIMEALKVSLIITRS